MKKTINVDDREIIRRAVSLIANKSGGSYCGVPLNLREQGEAVSDLLELIRSIAREEIAKQKPSRVFIDGHEVKIENGGE